MMAIAKVKSSDESEYRVYIENCHGSDEANFMLFVSGISNLNILDKPEVTMTLILDGSGMDFRTMLKKKKYAKHQQDDGDPDWGKLKHREGPDGEDEDDDGKVNKGFF